MEWEEIFANDMTNKGLISKTYTQTYTTHTTNTPHIHYTHHTYTTHTIHTPHTHKHTTHTPQAHHTHHTHDTHTDIHHTYHKHTTHTNLLKSHLWLVTTGLDSADFRDMGSSSDSRSALSSGTSCDDKNVLYWHQLNFHLKGG